MCLYVNKVFFFLNEIMDISNLKDHVLKKCVVTYLPFFHGHVPTAC